MVTTAYLSSGFGIILATRRAVRRLIMAAVTDWRKGMSLGLSRHGRAQGSFLKAIFRRPGLVHLACTGAAIAAVAALASCGSDSHTGPAAAKGPPPLATIRFNRTVDSVEIQRTSTITATFFDSTGAAVDASSLTWSSADTTVATVSSAGVVTGVHTGATSITLKADNDVSASLPVIVLPPAIATLTYPTTSYTMTEGDTLTIPAPTVTDRTGAVVTGRTPTYSVGYAGGVTVTPAGVVTAVFAGTVAVTATLDTAHTVLTFTVLPAAVAKVRVIPTVLDLGVGHTIATQASAYGQTGDTLLHRSYTYSVDNTSVATVTSYGLVRGLAPGTGTLTVSTGAGSEKVPISVAQLASGGFKIDVRFVGNVPQAVQTAALAAAARWEQVISAPLIPYHIVTQANDCGPGTPAVDTTETSLLVIVQSDSIDGVGKTAGLGGPCVIRDDPPQFTALGTITVDSADASSIQQQGVLTALLMHEMGHILGIGTLWSDGTVRDSDTFFPNTAAGLSGPDPVFIGPLARAAYAQLGFSVDSARGVPIENQGTVGDGTRGAHWRASVFGHELMTGTLHDGLDPLSRVTIEALADFGYTVVPEAADDFSVMNANNPSAPVQPSLSRNPPVRANVVATPGVPIRETILYPRFTVTRNGVMKRIRGSRQSGNQAGNGQAIRQ